jgi:hypothetical protein
VLLIPFLTHITARMVCGRACGESWTDWISIFPLRFYLFISCVSCFFGYFLTAYWDWYIANTSRLSFRLRYDMAGGWRLGMCLSVGLRGI